MDRSDGSRGGSPRVLRAARMSAPTSFSPPEYGFRAPLFRGSPPLYGLDPPPSSRRPGFARAPPPRHPVPFAASPPSPEAMQDAVQSGVAAASIADASPPARRSSRKRRAPEILEPSPPVEPRKRKASTIDAKKPPAKKKRAPARLKTDPDDDNDDAKEACDNNCCICMTEPEPQELAKINGCEHLFCFGCIEKWADRENSCPLCKTRFTSIDYVNTKPRGRGKSSVKVKNKSQRSELTSSIALESLFGDHSIAFESFFARLGANNRISTRFAQILVGGTHARESSRPITRAARAAGAASGSSPDAASSSAGRPSRAVPFPPPSAASVRFSDLVFGDDDEGDSDDGGGFSGFVSTIRDMEGRRRGRTGATFSFSSGLPSMHLSATFPSPPSRSYATNSNDATAGASADNALEIEDSDDDDDEVQIVGSRRPDHSRGM